MTADKIRVAVTIENFRPLFYIQILAEKSGFPKDSRDLARLAQSAAEICFCAGTALIAGIEEGQEPDETLIGSVLFKSSLLREKLAGHGRAFPYLVTEGREIAEWGEYHKKRENPEFVHAIRQMAVKTCERELEKKICARFGITLLSSLNPGSLREWPISGQGDLLSLFGTLPMQMGVRLSADNIMHPDYTVSGIFFQTDKKFYNCQLCPRENCPNRKAERKKPETMP